MISNHGSQPEIDSQAMDESGHTWTRGSDGWWRCADHDHAAGLAWSWDDVLDDAIGIVRVYQLNGEVRTYRNGVWTKTS